MGLDSFERGGIGGSETEFGVAVGVPKQRDGEALVPEFEILFEKKKSFALRA